MERERLSAGDLVDGRWRVVGWLGSGEMGDVYEVRGESNLETVALKLFRPQYSRMAHIWSSFEQACQSVAQLGLEQLVKVTEFGRDS
ncbi:MAG TPA: hypothetical protein VGJ84_01025, partial [Polyangiaceae bacterium]